ncbi:hypothetical protein JCM3765_003541 [Sporobolomyces pararoseus]
MQAYDQDYYLSLSSQFPLLTLDEAGVCSFLSHLGYPHYSQNLSEHNITGEVLIHLDHQALKDVGIHSVGQRLNILKTVYILKLLENIPIEEGNYVPPSEELEDGQIPSSQVIKLLTERDDRIRNLESEVHNLHLAFQHFKEETLTIARTTSHSLRSPTFHPLSNASTLSRSNSLSYGGPRPRQVPNPNLSITSPPSTSTSVLPDSPNSPIVTEQQQQQQPPTPSTNHLTVNDQSQSTGFGGVESASSSFSIDGIKTPTTPTYAPQTQVPPPTSTTSLTTTNSTTTNTTTSRSRERETTPSASASASAGGSGGDNPYRSFRVTLEDPCYKVLPAALKKYKINDDWRLYALFICYGNTERCLAYDEKPLLLFQRLKESNDNPVFMLRHIKDIKSPISVAAAKHAARRDKRLPGVGGGVERSLMGTNRDGTTTNASGLVGNARPTRLHHPPVLLPVGGGQQQQQHKTEEEETSTTSTKEKNNQGYCIAIYPYLAEREDEFDVSVGDTFIILSKTKGWWVVHRDGSNLSDPSQPSKSAWVPAGCLLETSVPPLSLSSSDNPPRGGGGGGGEISNAASIPILPSYVVSVSTPGIALMDYSPSKINNTTGGGGGGGIGELEVKKGQSLRILKRYNHWSYAIKEDGNRGWVPSWFCGRANKDNSTGGGGGQQQQQQQPITPTSSTIPGTGDNNRPVTAPTTVNTTNKPPISIAVPSSTSSSLPNNGVSNGGAKSAGPVLGTTSSVSSGGNGGNGTETDGKE